MAKSYFQAGDASLIAAATRAGTVAPPDLSQTFQAVSDSYHKSMMASAEMWGDIAAEAIKITDTIKKDTELNISPEAEALYEDPTFESLKNKIEENQSIIRKNVFNKKSPEYKTAIAKQKKLIAELEYDAKQITAATGYYQINEKTGETFVDLEMMQNGGMVYNLEMNHALQRTLAGKTTDRGNYFKTEDNEDGESRLYLYHDPSKVKKDQTNITSLPEHIGGASGVDQQGSVLGQDGKPLNFSASEIKNMNFLRNPKRAANMNSGINNVRELGRVSKDGGFDKYTQSMATSTIDQWANDEGSWYTNTLLGDSFHKEVTGMNATNGSKISAQLFKAMMAADGVLEGIEDTDGVQGITIGDLSDEDNMKTLQLNLFNQGDVNYDKANTTAVFKQWAMDKMQTVHADGWANSANNKGGGGGGIKPLNVDVYYKWGDQSQTGERIINRYNAFLEGEFKSYDDRMTFKKDKETGVWTVNDGEQTLPTTEAKIAEVMGFDEYRNRLGVKKDYQWGTTSADSDSDSDDSNEDFEKRNELSPSSFTWGQGASVDSWNNYGKQFGVTFKNKKGNTNTIVATHTESGKQKEITTWSFNPGKNRKKALKDLQSWISQL